MELSRVILGPVETEKAQRLIDAHRTYTLRVAPKATKVDVIAALKKYYDVRATGVRVMRMPGKVRAVSRGRIISKRKPFKKVMVTLDKKSKPLDIANFKL